MDNIKTFTDELDGSEHIIVHNEDGSIESMPKAVWDELQAKQPKGV